MTPCRYICDLRVFATAIVMRHSHIVTATENTKHGLTIPFTTTRTGNTRVVRPLEKERRLGQDSRCQQMPCRGTLPGVVEGSSIFYRTKAHENCSELWVVYGETLECFYVVH